MRKRKHDTQLHLSMVIAFSFTFTCVVGMLAVALIFYSTYRRYIEHQIVEDTKQVVNQMEHDLTNSLHDVMRVTDTLYDHIAKQQVFCDELTQHDLRLLYEANQDDLVSISCFDRSGNLIVSEPMRELIPQAELTRQTWFVQTMSDSKELFISNAHVQHVFLDADKDYDWVISFSRSVPISGKGDIHTGILLLDMKFGSIAKLFSQVNAGNIGYMYLIDQQGQIIYHPRQNLIDASLQKENNRQACAYTDGVYTETFQEEERLVIVKTLSDMGWKIVSVIARENIHEDRITLIWFMVLAVLILMLTIVNQYMSRTITQPLNKLERSVKQIDLQSPEQIYVGGSEEIQHLGRTLRKMVLQMQNLMQEVVREQEEKRKNELDALQSQIHPHFLYNSLDSIVWMIESGRYEEAVFVVTKLARLFRISLSKGKTIILLEDELQHAKCYSAIQQIRFKDKFQVKFDIEEGIGKYLTIKLIIQPILENAIYYGMESMDGDGEILIKGYTQGESVYLAIQDNGIGMTPAQVESIWKDGTQERKRGSGIGLCNVNQRIQLYFGQAYGLQIQSEPDVGTTVTIHLPKRLEEKGEK